MSGTVLRWFESYLTNRFYCVKVRNETSQNLPLKYGVPQGSVLVVIVVVSVVLVLDVVVVVVVLVVLVVRILVLVVVVLLLVVV